MTPEQKKALALAQARRRRAAAQQPQERGMGQVIYDNLIGDPNDGVTSTGESLGTWLNRAGESMTLGIVGDEASAAATGMLPGRSYDSELQRYRGNEENMSLLGKLSADVTGGLVPGVAGVKLISQGVTLPAKIGRGIAAGAGAGTVQGFMDGEGGVADRAGDAVSSAAIGGLIGGAVPVLGTLLQRAIRSGKEGLANSRIAKEAASQLGIRPQAARVLSESMRLENPADMAAAIRRAGPDAMLAEAAPGLQAQLDAAMRSPGQAARVAGPRIDQRAAMAGSGLNSALDQALGAPGGIIAPQAAIRGGTAAARGAAYDAAYSAPIDYSAQAGRSLEALVPRVPASVWRDADRLMQLDGDASRQIMAQIGEDGAVSLQRMPDVRQWDYIKRALEQSASSGEGQGALGGQTPLGRAFQSLARDVRDALGEAVPQYREALDTAADAIGRVQGVKLGADMLRPSMTREEVAMALERATGGEKAAIKQGLRQYIDDTLSTVRAAATDQNVDAREAQKALALLSSRASKDKIGALLGDAAEPVWREIEKASSALGLRARTAANSATAGRLMADQMMNDAIDPSLLRQGKPVAAAKEAFATAMGGSREAVNRLRADAKADLADVLTRSGSAEDIMRLLEDLSRRNTVDPAAGSALSRLLQQALIGSTGANASEINSGISSRMLPPR